MVDKQREQLGRGLFPALLKHWRHSRGLSQLDLALAADVSSRHISFLETGRSTPSPEMVLVLGNTLGVPLRHIDEMLTAAGHDAIYDSEDEGLPESVQIALDLLASHHEPYPLIAIDRLYNVVTTNSGADLLFDVLFADSPVDRSNLARLTFDPEGAHHYIVNFAEVGRDLLWRIQREILASPDDGDLRDLLDELLAMPTVGSEWREVDLSAPSEPTLVVRVKKDDVEARFISTATTFAAPQNSRVDGLYIETWFPADEPTRQLFELFTGAA